MTQKIQAIEDNAGGLHVAMLDDDGCWWLSHDWEQCPEGRMRRDITQVQEDIDRHYAASRVRTQHGYEELVDGGALVIATLEGGEFTHIDVERMGAAGRRWLGTRRFIAIEANSGLVWGDSAELEGKRFYGSGLDYVAALDRHINGLQVANREYWSVSIREADEQGGWHIYLASADYALSDERNAAHAVIKDCPHVLSVSWSERA